MEPGEITHPVPGEQVSACTVIALSAVYSAPMPGAGSRYADNDVAHERRLIAVTPVQQAMARAGSLGVGETVLEAVIGCRGLAGFADFRSVGYLAPLARTALLGEPLGRILAQLGHEEIHPFHRALEAAGDGGPLATSLQVALGAGGGATLRDAMRFAAARDPLAREYARGYEIPIQLARPAILTSLSRTDSARAALVQSYLEVLSEVPDLDVIERAGRREAEDVSRMANGVLKSGGAHSSRGLQAIANLDGLLRADPRLVPSATEAPVAAAAFLFALEYGPQALSLRMRPAARGNKGR